MSFGEVAGDDGVFVPFDRERADDVREPEVEVELLLDFSSDLAVRAKDRIVLETSPDQLTTRVMDLLTPLGDESRELLRRRITGVDPPEEVVVIDSEGRNPVARELLRFHGMPGWSISREYSIPSAIALRMMMASAAISLTSTMLIRIGLSRAIC